MPIETFVAVNVESSIVLVVIDPVMVLWNVVTGAEITNGLGVVNVPV